MPRPYPPEFRQRAVAPVWAGKQSKQVAYELGITANKTRPYRPQTNGKIERFHRTLAEGWAFKKVLQLRIRSARSPAIIDPRVQPPPAPLGKQAPIT